MIIMHNVNKVINNNVVNTDSIVNNSYQVVLSLEEKVKCLEEILNKIKKI